MSQNLDATAINQIHALISAQGVNEIISKIGADAVALPENFRIHDLEKFNLNRFRFRGALSTASIDDFTRYSKEIDAVIREKYGLPPVMSTPVKYADLIMLATERRDLGLDDGSFWPVLEGIPATEMFNVIPLAPGHAYGMFMERFNELSELRKCA
ncbi:DUF2303 family protein [Salmonella enterica subsp. enterica serovar Montevideo]|nr:DUF2303 family protein [Salmonella enterica subsp. enterica serovar Montevideo]